jgi:hypothetical protein
MFAREKENLVISPVFNINPWLQDGPEIAPVLVTSTAAICDLERPGD